jgi:hypothetical protein
MPFFSALHWLAWAPLLQEIGLAHEKKETEGLTVTQLSEAFGMMCCISIRRNPWTWETGPVPLLPFATAEMEATRLGTWGWQEIGVAGPASIGDKRAVYILD